MFTCKNQTVNILSLWATYRLCQTFFCAYVYNFPKIHKPLLAPGPDQCRHSIELWNCTFALEYKHKAIGSSQHNKFPIVIKLTIKIYDCFEWVMTTRNKINNNVPTVIAVVLYFSIDDGSPQKLCNANELFLMKLLSRNQIDNQIFWGCRCK